MSKFIEEFYYGNLDPQARSTKQNKAVQKQIIVSFCVFFCLQSYSYLYPFY